MSFQINKTVPVGCEQTYQTYNKPDKQLTFFPFDSFSLTQNLSSTEQETVQKQLNTVTEEELNDFLEKISTYEGMLSITNDMERYERYPVIGLKALQIGSVTEEQVATICSLYSAIKQMVVDPTRYSWSLGHDEKNTSVYSKIELTDDQKKSLSCQIRCHSFGHHNDKMFIYLKNFFYASDEFKTALANPIEQSPFSERCFWTIACPLDHVCNWSPLYHRIHDLSFSFLRLIERVDEYQTPFTSLKQKLMIIPSFTWVKTTLKIMFLSNSILKLQPVFGELSKEHIIAAKKKHIRPVNFSFPGIPLPPSADGYPTGGDWSFTLHDYYHAWRDSVIPDCYLRVFERFMHIIDDLLKDEHIGQKDKDGLKEIQWKLADADGLVSMSPVENNMAKISCLSEVLKVLNLPEQLKKAIQRDYSENSDVWGAIDLPYNDRSYLSLLCCSLNMKYDTKSF